MMKNIKKIDYATIIDFMQTKEAINNLMNYSLPEQSVRYYVGFLKQKINEIDKLRDELKQKNIKLNEVSKELYEEYISCVSCLNFRGRNDNVNYLD